mmetsp:Transcript_27896/g.50869  ORF Transcript_27896/g.50869 Transcript_27896/m.50869 type:complete len:389 (+) Transcript_27896:118-1284(+)
MLGFFAILNAEGVTSRSSSLAIYSTDASNDNSIGAVIPMVIPLVAERMLVSAFVLQTLTARSPGRWWIPIIIFLYVSSPDWTNNLPLSCAFSSPNEVTIPFSNANKDPLSLDWISPAILGLYESNTASMMAVPLVADNSSDLTPSIPRVGMRYLITLMLSPPSSSPMSCNSPARVLNRSITLPEYSSGTRTSTISNGSSIFPVSSFSLMMTTGGPTSNSNPSRRIVSMRTVRCNCPRPETAYLSADSVSSTWRATLRSSSLKRRSRIMREVRNLPSRPARGDLFTPRVIRTVGSSTAMGGRGSAASAPPPSFVMRVSPISIFSRPENMIISPAEALWTSLLPRLSKTYNDDNRPVFFGLSGCANATGWPDLTDPLVIRAMPIFPLKLS